MQIRPFLPAPLPPPPLAYLSRGAAGGGLASFGPRRPVRPRRLPRCLGGAARLGPRCGSWRVFAVIAPAGPRGGGGGHSGVKVLKGQCSPSLPLWRGMTQPQPAQGLWLTEVIFNFF